MSSRSSRRTAGNDRRKCDDRARQLSADCLYVESSGASSASSEPFARPGEPRCRMRRNSTVLTQFLLPLVAVRCDVPWYSSLAVSRLLRGGVECARAVHGPSVRQTQSLAGSRPPCTVISMPYCHLGEVVGPQFDLGWHPGSSKCVLFVRNLLHPLDRFQRALPRMALCIVAVHKGVSADEP